MSWLFDLQGCQIQNLSQMNKIARKLKPMPHIRPKSPRTSLDSDSLTSLFLPWQKRRHFLIYADAQTGRTVQSTEFYLFYISILFLVMALGLAAISIWSIVFRLIFTFLVDCSIELAYFTLSNAILCLPCFWIAFSIHNDDKSRYNFLSIILFLLTIAIVLLIVGTYVGFTHKLHMKLNQIDKNINLLNEFRNSMNKSMYLSKTNERNKQIWNELQTRLNCCGIDNYTDWFRVSDGIPKTCYKEICFNNTTYHSPGCLKILVANLALQTSLFNGVNCAALFTQSCTFIAVTGIYFNSKIKQEG